MRSEQRLDEERDGMRSQVGRNVANPEAPLRFTAVFNARWCCRLARDNGVAPSTMHFENRRWIAGVVERQNLERR